MNQALREYVYKTKGLEKSICPLNVLNISLVLYLTIHKTQYSLAPTYTYDIYKNEWSATLKVSFFCEQHKRWKSGILQGTKTGMR